VKLALTSIQCRG